MVWKAALALTVVVAPVQPAWAKQSTKINVAEGKELYSSAGDTLVRVTLKESLPNAFGGADIFGRTRDRGFVELRFMGIAPDGRAVFHRRSVDIYSNETTMSRSGLRTGSATVTASGNMATIEGYSTAAPASTIFPLAADTIELAIDPAKPKTFTVEDRLIEILSADENGVTFIVRKRTRN